MDTIEEVGFLSPDIDSWIDKHRSENKPWFELARDLNRIGQKLLLTQNPPKTDEQKILVVLLFSRALSHFQGVLILIERGMVSEARSLLRGMLDATFSVVALSKHAELIERFVNDDVYQRLKYVNCFTALPKDLKKIHRISSKQLKSLKAELEAEIKEKGITPLTTEFLAQKAGMQGHYNTLFTLLSASTHSRVRDMERHLVLDNKEDIKELAWGPDIADLEDTISPSCECLFIAIRAVADLYEYKNLDAKYEKCWRNYQDLSKTAP